MQLEANRCNCRCQANLLLKKGNAAVLPETDIRFEIYIWKEIKSITTCVNERTWV